MNGPGFPCSRAVRRLAARGRVRSPTQAHWGGLCALREAKAVFLMHGRAGAPPAFGPARETNPSAGERATHRGCDKSDCGEAGCPRITSGARYIGVPANSGGDAASSSRPVPKSISTIRPSASRMTLCPLTSRCTSPTLWTALKAPSSGVTSDRGDFLCREGTSRVQVPVRAFGHGRAPSKTPTRPSVGSAP